MKVVDARSGKELKVGQGVLFSRDGDSVQLLDLRPGLLDAWALLRTRYVDHPSGRLIEDTHWSPLTVRWLHPKYLLQHVGFINT